MRVRLSLAMLLPLLLVAAAPEPAPRYVPATGWRDNDWAAPFHERWFGGHLRAMREPPLATAGDLGRSRRRFRLLVLPTFGRPFAFRIDENTEGGAKLRQVVLDGRGGYDPGNIAKESERNLTRDETARIDKGIASAHLESLPMEAPEPRMRNGEITVCADGTAFVFELLDRKRRVFLMRGCVAPEKSLWRLIGTIFRLDPRTDWQAAAYAKGDG